MRRRPMIGQWRSRLPSPPRCRPRLYTANRACLGSAAAPAGCSSHYRGCDWPATSSRYCTAGDSNFCRWANTAVGYFLGRRPYFHHVKEYVQSVWPMVREVTATSNGFYFFQFKTNVAMEEVIEGGPWLFQGQPIILQKWTPGLVLRKLQHTQVPVWVKLRHLPVELWTDEGLSTVASGVGKPLYPDAITRACTRLDFARVCVMLDINSKLPRHLVIMVPHDDGSESPCKVDIEYEWLPPKCTTCMSLGHSTAGCPTVKPRQPPVHVYVPRAPPRHNRVERTEQHAQPSRPRPQPREPRTDGVDGGDGIDGGALTAVRREDKALLPTWMINAGFWNVRGLNRRDHQVAIADLVSEYHLYFIGLLETRVAFNNVACVQRGLLPRWNYYVDYGGPGNRIWLAWDVDFVDVTVVETGDQFIHCSVYIRAFHTRVVITVVYGVNDVIGRRVLWADLVRLSTITANEPWLVGGDFNTVLDASEVCGQSGDIRGAAEEFQGCLQDTGLIALPVQGERFTWHNCSRDSRSLWKRLDRLLVNDRWLMNWPSTTYVSLTARTSDHSPLILRGDTTARTVGMFRFDNYLARSTEFTPSVHRIWQHRIVGTAMYAVTRKLKALKPIFRAQRRKKGDLSNNVSLATGFLETAQTLLARDRHCPILLHLEFCCKLVLRLASRLEQSMLQQRSKMAWMKDGDQCSRLFFRKELLGGRPRDRFIDLRHLRPWARHIITETEAEALVLPVSPDEVKQALFDIDESKAPGPDGYSAGFFKAAWPVIGGEVTRAIRDFFQTGRLLKQVITKILVQRMRGILDTLISPSQNAFVPGRAIGDNILLAQELFSGYNQKHSHLGVL
ncbi:UNVERIFIED_CONTAM: hypothetical protein Sradi_6934200 [Sesamum radiatum]|uniref:DUF4283 domain-containing protein n=1 Tax=Sesamum radiatum TaxID=300843 RepID=A0AAW2JGI4_SESRA